ncbi:hypothetical protein MVES_003107 [Malassezia vespertilionis]|uniref:Abp1p n=1 Tax=Malassezia vespertilionis TaxID=2020962 RepID=A0A2N1J961_9BASI|nr:hypothetical protein MVES_003107 [Malassezia vespertilionis]
MSLQVNLGSPAIQKAYEQVLDGVNDYAVLSYKKQSNDLDVVAACKGTLEDMAEELSDGKMQYAFVRVKDPNTELPKFVLINWLGEGVPEMRKGLFPSHCASVADYFKAYHVTIQARTEADIEPAAIMRKVTDSSGSKYGSASSRSGGQIAPVGTNYKPVGTPDVRGMQSKAPRDTIAPVGTAYTAPRDELAQLRAGKLQDPGQAPSAPRPGQPQQPKPAQPSKPAQPPASTPKPVPAPEEPQKPIQDDRIQPVGTSYERVNLGQPKKLSSARTALFSQVDESVPVPAPASAARVPSGGKLSWSQRQEAARNAHDAEAKSEGAKESTATTAPPASTPNDHLATQMADASISGSQRATVLYDYEAAEDNELTLREGDVLTHIEQVDEDWWSAKDASGAVGLFPATYVELLEEQASAAAQSSPHAIALYEYEIGEDNEIELAEGDKIVDIEFASDDWWNGKNERTGLTGLFPANYVEYNE